MNKGAGSETTIIIGPSKSVLVYALHSLNVLGLARFRVFVPKLYYIISIIEEYSMGKVALYNILKYFGVLMVCKTFVILVQLALLNAFLTSRVISAQ